MGTPLGSGPGSRLELTSEFQDWFRTEIVPAIAQELLAAILPRLDQFAPALEGPPLPRPGNSKKSRDTVPLQKLLLTKREAAHLLSVSLRTIENQISWKQLAVRRIGRRVLIPFSQLERFAQRDHP